ncbi:MAG TPA: DUF4255 domain-containing protein [Streptomyces sp.]|nr:DUF4255 domain-containing protein [Streptomyces sp.]
MSNVLAVAAVTTTLQYLLHGALAGGPGPVAGADVSTLHPGQLENQNEAGINLFCYRSTPNAAWNNTGLPTRQGNGTVASRPFAALDLHYLITFYGNEEALEPQRLLGRAAAALAALPMFPRGLVTAALDHYDDKHGFLAKADLAQAQELVKLSPIALSLDETANLWSMLDAPYRLSLTCLATVAVVTTDLSSRTALPVRRRVLSAAPAGPPGLQDIATEPAGTPVVNGAVLVLRGSRLLGRRTSVRIGPARLDPNAGATAAKLRITVTDEVPAGVHTARIEHHAADGRPLACSNAVPVLVRPSVTVGRVAASVALTVDPPLRAGQRVTVLLSSLADGAALSITLAPVTAASQRELSLRRSDIPDGHWLVRVQVDGVDSLPELVGDRYAAPALTLPPP